MDINSIINMGTPARPPLASAAQPLFAGAIPCMVQASAAGKVAVARAHVSKPKSKKHHTLSASASAASTAAPSSGSLSVNWGAAAVTGGIAGLGCASLAGGLATDLIGNVIVGLGVDKQTAEALAGSVLGGIQSTLANKVDKGTAQDFGNAVGPDLQQWVKVAGAVLGAGAAAKGASGGAAAGGGGGGGGIVETITSLISSLLGGGALGSILGGVVGGGGAVGNDGTLRSIDLKGITSLISKLGLEPTNASRFAPIVLGFLQAKLDKNLLSKVLSVAPFFTALLDAKGDLSAAFQKAGGVGGVLDAAKGFARK